MNVAYTGNVGSGKSINAMRAIFDQWASGGVVISNIRPMFDPYCDIETKVEYMGCRQYLRDVHQWEFQDGQFIHLSQEKLKQVNYYLPRGDRREILVVVDEASEVWDSGKRFDASEEVLSLFRQSRKLKLSFLLITQDFSWLHDRMRTLCQWVYHHAAVQDMKIPGLGWRLVPQGVCGSIISSYQRGGGKLSHTKDAWKIHDKKLYGTYRTDELFSDLGVLDAIKCDFSATGKIEQKKAGSAVVWAMAGLLSIFAVFASVIIGKSLVAKQDRLIKLLESRTAIDLGPLSNSLVSVSRDIQQLSKSPTWEGSETPGVRFAHFDGLRKVGKTFEAFIEGEWYIAGKVTRAGIVVAVGNSCVKLLGPNGKTRWIMASDVRPPDPVAATSVSSASVQQPSVTNQIASLFSKP